MSISIASAAGAGVAAPWLHRPRSPAAGGRPHAMCIHASIALLIRRRDSQTRATDDVSGTPLGPRSIHTHPYTPSTPEWTTSGGHGFGRCIFDSKVGIECRMTRPVQDSRLDSRSARAIRRRLRQKSELRCCPRLSSVLPHSPLFGPEEGPYGALDGREGAEEEAVSISTARILYGVEGRQMSKGAASLRDIFVGRNRSPLIHNARVVLHEPHPVHSRGLACLLSLGVWAVGSISAAGGPTGRGGLGRGGAPGKKPPTTPSRVMLDRTRGARPPPTEHRKHNKCGLGCSEEEESIHRAPVQDAYTQHPPSLPCEDADKRRAVPERVSRRKRTPQQSGRRAGIHKPKAWAWVPRKDRSGEKGRKRPRAPKGSKELARKPGSVPDQMRFRWARDFLLARATGPIHDTNVLGNHWHLIAGEGVGWAGACVGGHNKGLAYVFDAWLVWKTLRREDWRRKPRTWQGRAGDRRRRTRDDPPLRKVAETTCKIFQSSKLNPEALLKHGLKLAEPQIIVSKRLTGPDRFRRKFVTCAMGLVRKKGMRAKGAGNQYTTSIAHQPSAAWPLALGKYAPGGVLLDSAGLSRSSVYCIHSAGVSWRQQPFPDAVNGGPYRVWRRSKGQLQRGQRWRQYVCRGEVDLVPVTVKMEGCNYRRATRISPEAKESPNCDIPDSSGPFARKCEHSNNSGSELKPPRTTFQHPAHIWPRAPGLIMRYTQ
ncbi:hypothetical protein B0H14DRAFT_3715483 [Mycena olivaceomarginata]|nr:hypothetical protein B0H14DRAFT_3715483 [Mycena olivaceomarginata]